MALAVAKILISMLEWFAKRTHWSLLRNNQTLTAVHLSNRFSDTYFLFMHSRHISIMYHQNLVIHTAPTMDSWPHVKQYRSVVSIHLHQWRSCYRMCNPVVSCHVGNIFNTAFLTQGSKAFMVQIIFVLPWPTPKLRPLILVPMYVTDRVLAKLSQATFSFKRYRNSTHIFCNWYMITTQTKTANIAVYIWLLVKKKLEIITSIAAH